MTWSPIFIDPPPPEENQTSFRVMLSTEGMLLIALNDSERAEYPSERKGAMDKVIDINRRLEEIQERKRREAESDETNLFDKLDGILAGANGVEATDETRAIFEVNIKQKFAGGCYEHRRNDQNST